MHRREFIKTIAAAGAMSLIDPKNPLAGRTIASPGYFGIHQFIETHPNAVFIKRTNVAYKTDSGAKKQEGLELAREIFILRHTPGIPLSHKFAIKPNITWAGGMANTERGMTIITDWNFVEGMIEGVKELGILAEQIYIREGGWTRGAWTEERLSTPYIGVAERTGVHLFDFPTGREIHELTVETAEEGTEVTWSDFAEGIVFRRIPHVAPLNEPDAWLLNISKFKTHGMGMTLCTKNLQGASMRPHLEFCEGVDTTKQQPEHIFNDFQPDLEEHVEQLPDGQNSKLSIDQTISQAEDQPYHSISIHIASKELTMSSRNSPGPILILSLERIWAQRGYTISDNCLDVLLFFRESTIKVNCPSK